MPGKWFVQKDETVEGPLTTEDVQARVQSGQLGSTHMIWGRAQGYWSMMNTWNAEAAEMTSVPQMSAMPEAWHFAVNGQSHGPMIRATLLGELKRIEALGPVMLWTKGMKEWAPLFEFHDILSELGVNKRQFPRADISGKAILKADGNTLVAPLISISEGGFGIQLDSGIVSGQVFTVELHSPAFRDVLNVKAEVRYASHGVIGMKFINVNVEARGLIIQLVRQNQVRFAIKAA